MNKIPVIDVFAGPGGLGEGFAAYSRKEGEQPFRVVLSIEKDMHAHRTLELRAFFREFDTETVPKEYYQYLRGEICRAELLGKYPAQAEHAARETWCAELGSQAFPPETVDKRIREATGSAASWVLTGGPPCQAYSTAGRSRIRDLLGEEFERDPRHLLYREFLRILAVHRPPVFLMENVEGILSSKLNGENIFQRIFSELEQPGLHTEAATLHRRASQHETRYRIRPLAAKTLGLTSDGTMSDFIVRCEDYGVPQTRHRVILLGVREDIRARTGGLQAMQRRASVWDAIGDLPKLRSGLTRERDSGRCWAAAIRAVTRCQWFRDGTVDSDLRGEILNACDKLDKSLDRGATFVPSESHPVIYGDWYQDERLRGACNHCARPHMRKDLHRYLFVSCFGRVHGRSPVLRDFPRELLPNHRNAELACRTGTRLFSDRFRVHLQDSAARTITSHILHDGHYFIHPDPSQCRSLTVREAARIQTFPDNYFFEGPRTEQYRQVGNAVPPMLARRIAGIIHDILVQDSNAA